MNKKIPEFTTCEDISINISSSIKNNYGIFIEPDHKPIFVNRGRSFVLCELFAVFRYKNKKEIAFIADENNKINDPLYFLFKDAKSTTENDIACIVKEMPQEREIIFDSTVNSDITKGFIYFKVANNTLDDHFAMYYSYDIERNDGENSRLFSSLCKMNDPKIIGNFRTLAIQQYHEHKERQYEFK